MIQYPRLEHLVHEFGHVWGLPHNYSGGLWSLMGHRNPTVSSFMNSYEREQLGWINFNNVSVDGTTATVSDFATTGVAYRVVIPNTNPPESFLVENHRQIALYDTVDISSATGPGLYILQDNGLRHVEANNIRVVAADGRWNWSNPYWIHNPYSPNPLDSLPVFQRGTINRANGNTDKVFLPHSKGGTHPIWAWLDEQTGVQMFGPRYKGDGKDRFTFTDNNVFSPWSGYAAYNWNSTAATTIGVEITGTSGSNINVKFYTTSPVNGPPSKPQDLLVSAGSGQPLLLWTGNSEPDVDPYGSYRIERRYKLEGNSWTSWSEIASVNGDVTQWTDEEIGFQYIFGANDSLQYRIRAKDTQNKLSAYSDVVTLRGVVELPKTRASGETPLHFDISQNYPNPFNPATTIKYQLEEDGFVSLKVFDVLGREVATLVNGEHVSGYYSATFGGQDVSSGVYFARFVVTGALGEVKYSKMTKLVLMK